MKGYRQLPAVFFDADCERGCVQTARYSHCSCFAATSRAPTPGPDPTSGGGERGSTFGPRRCSGRRDAVLRASTISYSPTSRWILTPCPHSCLAFPKSFGHGRRRGVRAAGSARPVGPSGLCGLNPVSGVTAPAGLTAERRAWRDEEDFRGARCEVFAWTPRTLHHLPCAQRTRLREPRRGGHHQTPGSARAGPKGRPHGRSRRKPPRRASRSLCCRALNQEPRPRRCLRSRVETCAKGRWDGLRPRQGGLRPRQGGLRPRQDGLRSRQDGLRPRQDGLRPCQDGLRRLGLCLRFARDEPSPHRRAGRSPGSNFLHVRRRAAVTYS
jgi:hypothetical protein